MGWDQPKHSDNPFVDTFPVQLAFTACRNWTKMRRELMRSSYMRSKATHMNAWAEQGLDPHDEDYASLEVLPDLSTCCIPPCLGCLNFLDDMIMIGVHIVWICILSNYGYHSHKHTMWWKGVCLSEFNPFKVHPRTFELIFVIQCETWKHTHRSPPNLIWYSSYWNGHGPCC